ncbi:hypothetical protein FOA43_001527 [Brettanomyces nanus]|uniref:Structural maintenance of chromosomes protein 5 n=1 Tax=Eeniella nana TaxID=13502 RepID=A0A875RZW5_EENNA|nr:uncharacterized protein FOA43_001527 [Brettanomyces nanus]QPG74203.1 hypothetical protein FOA43_001527 [Brettanomyces nanus]
MSRTATEAQIDLKDFLPKRLKTRRKVDLSQFQAGSIIRVKLRNFMSYALTEFHFGPKMNLIIGPNGSGKSTFVCAVCIALAGRLEFLGKSSMTLDQFIKIGEKSATIVLELKGDHANDTMLIERQLTLGSKSTWSVDGEQCGETALKKRLQHFNIQLGNLCQFLPQDRVARFASLKPEELLKAIEKIHGDGELLTQHEHLIELYNQRKDTLKTMDELNHRLEGLQEKHETLKQHAEKMKEYQNLENELKRLESARTYASLDTKKTKRKQLHQLYSQKVKQVESYKKEIAPWQESLQNSDQAVLETQKQIDECSHEQEKCMRHVEQGFQKIEQVEKLISKLQDDKAYNSTRLESRIRKLQSLSEEYQSCTDALNGINPLSDDEIKNLKSERQRFHDKQIELSEPIESVTEEISGKRIEISGYAKELNDLRKSLNGTDRLFTLDQRRFHHLIESVKLLRADAPRLHIQCFEPAVVSLRVKDERCAPVLERIIRGTNLSAFTVPNKAEYDKLTRYLYDDHYEQGRGVGVRTLGLHFNMQSYVPREAIIAMGFDGYVTDFIDGPQEVIRMLCENENFHNTPIMFGEFSPSELKKIVDRVSSGQYHFTRIVVGDSIYNFMRSSFGSHQVTTMIRPVPKKSTIFTDSISEDQRVEVEARIGQLNEKIENLKKEMNSLSDDLAVQKSKQTSLDAELTAVRAKISHHSKQQQAKLKYETQILTFKDAMKVEKRAIKRMKRHGNEDEMSQTLNKMHELEKERITILAGIEPEMETVIELDEKTLEYEVKKLQEQNKGTAIEQLSSSITSTLDSMLMEKTDVKKRYIDAKVNYEEALNKYKQELMLYTEEKKQEVREKVEELKSQGLMSEEGVAAEIDRVKSSMKLQRARGGMFSIEMLEENERAIKELEESVPEHEINASKRTEEIDKIVDGWKPKLESIVRIIATDFGENLRHVASGGDVQLDCESENYAEWKLRILVSFRDNEDLVQLNTAQQSGGEKSVTTAVFLNSLQGLTNTPFRIVDEINQGMDSNNERLVHKMIVEKTITTKHASQYFLITPKLLTGLYYSDQMTVHCIFAGRWCPKYENKTEFLEMGVLDKYCE